MFLKLHLLLYNCPTPPASLSRQEARILLLCVTIVLYTAKGFWSFCAGRHTASWPGLASVAFLVAVEIVLTFCLFGSLWTMISSPSEAKLPKCYSFPILG